MTSIFLLLTLGGSVLAGLPPHTSGMDSRMMGCCDKAKSKDQSSEATAARLCCAINCPSPTQTPSGLLFNFAPSNIEISRSVAEQISALFQIQRGNVEPLIRLDYFRAILPRTLQPRYIQHKSFLI